MDISEFDLNEDFSDSKKVDLLRKATIVMLEETIDRLKKCIDNCNFNESTKLLSNIDIASNNISVIQAVSKIDGQDMSQEEVDNVIENAKRMTVAVTTEDLDTPNPEKEDNNTSSSFNIQISYDELKNVFDEIFNSNLSDIVNGIEKEILITPSTLMNAGLLKKGITKKEIDDFINALREFEGTGTGLATAINSLIKNNEKLDIFRDDLTVEEICEWLAYQNSNNDEDDSENADRETTSNSGVIPSVSDDDIEF